MTYPMQKTAWKKHILIYIYDLRPSGTPPPERGGLKLTERRLFPQPINLFIR